MVGNSNDETKFPHKLLLSNAQVSRIRKDFANDPSANIKFSETQLPKIVHSEGFLLGLLDPLSSISSIMNLYAKELNNWILKVTFLQIKDLTILVKTNKKTISTLEGSGLTPTNNEIKDVTKVIWSLENRGILLNETTRKIFSQE